MDEKNFGGYAFSIEHDPRWIDYAEKATTIQGGNKQFTILL